LLPGGNDAVWLSAATMLLPDTAAPAVIAVDQMVALASVLVERAPEQIPQQGRAHRAVDAYVLAVGLFLRDRLDEKSDGTDRKAGAEELLKAARMIPLDHSAATVILRSLGAFLDRAQPLDDVLGAVADGFADRIDGALALRSYEASDLVTLHALRCLCRAERALADLRRAAGAVPSEYPWRTTIGAAAGA
jgi:hypothetical protein